MAKSNAICDQRAGEYQDSWALENLRTPYLDSILYTTDVVRLRNCDDGGKAFKRLVIMAAMCDIKLSRMGGPFKEDTYIDLNNYNSAFCTLRREFEELLAKGTQ